MRAVSFTEAEIQSLFGHEAAEDEDPLRLRSYYFKSATYDHIATDLPIRVLVGHKGIGKSALFQIAIAEEIDANRIAVLVKPDDVADLGTSADDFLKIVRSWKLGLSEIVAGKVLAALGSNGDDLASRIKAFGGNAIEFIRDTLAKSRSVDFSKANRVLVEHFLQSKIITVYIDDLDRGWEGRPQDVMRISALLNAVRDLANESRGLRFRVSLRSDVYYLVRTSDESTDKIEGSVIWQSWKNHEIFVLLIKRIETFFSRPVIESDLLKSNQTTLAHYLHPIMEDRFNGAGLWQDAPMYRVLMSLIRKRPRDLVKLCTLAARKARDDGNSLIATQNFRDSFTEYSQGRIQDTINEFRSELPDIKRLLLGMKPSKREKKTRDQYIYSTAALLKKLEDVRQSGTFLFADGRHASNKDLAAFLYKINFLTARKNTSTGIVRLYFEENRYLSDEFVDFGFDWEIHPAYRWALQPDSVHDIFETLELSIE